MTSRLRRLAGPASGIALVVLLAVVDPPVDSIWTNALAVLIISALIVLAAVILED